MEQYDYINGQFCVLLVFSVALFSSVVWFSYVVWFGLVEEIQSFEKRIRLPVLVRVLPERAFVLGKRNRRKQ